MADDNLIYYGGAVKALGDGKIGGYLIRYSDETQPDLVGDFFSPETDLGAASIPGQKIPVYYQHGFDKDVKSRRLDFGEVTPDELGVWLQTQLDLRDEYEKRIYGMVEANKMGFSSQPAGTLVWREPVGKAFHIKSWPIAEASLTPTPAEWRNMAIPVKSLYNTKISEREIELEPKLEEDIMTEEVKAEVKQEPIDFQALIKQAVDEAVKSMKEQEPPKPVGGVKVDIEEDEADKALRLNPFKKHEFFKAVYNAEVYNQTDKRLLPLKSEGLNEAIPSEGGFLVQSDIAAGISENIWGIGKVLQQISPINVKGNGMTFRAIDETSRAAGSRMGGVRGYWMGEGGTKTASNPTFRNIELKLKKVAALVYATDELLDDASALEGWLTRNVPAELRFLVEDSFIDGTGVGMPLGILQSGALVQATRQDASEVDADDIGNMWAARYAGVGDYVWFINQSVMPQLMRMSIAGSGYEGVYMPPGGLLSAPYGTLLGRPVIETEYNPYLGTVGDILLASPSQYVAITKGGVQAASSIHVRFVYDETAFRFVYRVDGSPLWASPVTAFDGTAEISPFVALQATT